jgi:hypothetical protein
MAEYVLQMFDFQRQELMIFEALMTIKARMASEQSMTVTVE